MAAPEAKSAVSDCILFGIVMLQYGTATFWLTAANDPFFAQPYRPAPSVYLHSPVQ